MFIILLYLITRSTIYFSNYLFERMYKIDHNQPSLNESNEPNNEASSESTNFGESSDVNDVTDAEMLGTLESGTPESGIVSNQHKHRKFAKFVTPKDSPVYLMTQKKRGKCIIFNHEKFERESRREGTNYDENAINETFSALGFEVKIYKDLKVNEIMDVIMNLQNEEHYDCDCICFFVLTHGKIGDNISAYDMTYPVQMIWQPFNSDSCISLAGKPKLFFIQACRGVSSDSGIQGRSCDIDSDEMTYILPTTADFLYAYSTMEGCYSFRDTNQGSWYIQTLCKVINKHWRDCDLLKMLTITLRKVATEYSSQHYESDKDKKKQMPTFTSTLTRDLYFNSVE
ncbi:caspase-1-like [Apis laboriosa]|uniref:caspase-1-like n=1 Tax=Apis laboriosa TaxID=183418 RepID=UPI001CC42C8A|nr:caspase-1-like [Apis laboriosa]